MLELQDFIAVLRSFFSWPSLIGGLIGLALLYLWAAVRSGANRERAFRRTQGLPDAEQPMCLRGQRVSQRRRDVSPVRRRVEAEIARAERRRLREGWGDDPVLARRYRAHGDNGEAA